MFVVFSVVFSEGNAVGHSSGEGTEDGTELVQGDGVEGCEVGEVVVYDVDHVD